MRDPRVPRSYFHRRNRPCLRRTKQSKSKRLYTLRRRFRLYVPINTFIRSKGSDEPEISQIEYYVV